MLKKLKKCFFVNKFNTNKIEILLILSFLVQTELVLPKLFVVKKSQI